MNALTVLRDPSSAPPPQGRGPRRLALSLCVLAVVGFVVSATRLLAHGGLAWETLLLLACAAFLGSMTLGMGRAGRGADHRPTAQPGAAAGGLGVLDALPVGVIVLDQNERPVVWNAVAERLLGGAAQRIAEFGLIPPGWRVVRDDGTPVAAGQHPARLAMLTGTEQRSETLGLYRPDDTVVWLSVSAVPLASASPRESRSVVCTFSDITRQRQRDRALMAREAQILRALDGAPFGLWSVDSRGRISFFAGTAAGGPGRPADLTGQSATDLARGVPAFAEELRRALRGESFTALHEMDGRFYETRFYPSRDPGGTIDGASGISIDVTARLAAEAEQAKLQDALRHAAEEWRATFDAIDSPLLVLDADDKVQRVNQATRALWEEPYESIIGSRLPDEAPGLPWGAMSHAAARCRATGGTVTLQEWDEATEREWDVTASSVGGPTGVAARVIVMARDVSDIVELRESLRRSERMSVMGELVSGVAHQVRNPLFGLCATLDACEAEHGSRPELRDYVQDLRSQSSRLSRLMSHLLEYGRAGRVTRVSGSLAAVVASAAAACGPVSRAARVELVVCIPDDLPPLVLDEGRLQEAVQNVIENAVQHSASEGQVRIVVRRDDVHGREMIVCDVDDDGPGFKAGEERRVFEPFVSRRSGGTGLGLSIAQRIVHEHGGSIVAANRAGGGARVTITLPLSGAAEGSGGAHA